MNILKRFGADQDLLNLKDRKGNTPLMHAVKNNQLEAVRYLCGEGAAVGMFNSQAFAASHMAASCGATEILKVLHKHGDSLMASNIVQWTPLHYALKYNHPETVEYLLEVIDVGAIEDNKDLLYLAATVNSESVVRALLELGEQADATNHNQWTFLMFAASNGHSDLMKKMQPIIAPGMYTMVDRLKRNLAHLAVIGGHLNVLQLLDEMGFGGFDEPDHYRKKPIHYAAEMGYPSLIGFLATKNDINGTDRDGNMPIHLAAMVGNLDVVKKLLEFENIIVDQKNNYDQSPLYVAVAGCHNDIASLLMEKGADPNTCCKGKPLISHAVCCNNSKIVEQLCNTDGVDVFKKDALGWTAVHFAAQLCHVDELQLFESINKESLFELTNNHRSAVHIAAIWNSMGVIPYYMSYADCPLFEEQDQEGNTCLHHAVKYGHVNIAHLLQQLVPNTITVPNKRGQTPLHVAIETWEDAVINHLILSGKSDLAARDANGMTPFLLAVSLGQRKTVLLILRQYPMLDLRETDNKGNTAIHLAAGLSCSRILELLHKSKKFDLELKNKNGMTPLDIASEKKGACLMYLAKVLGIKPPLNASDDGIEEEEEEEEEEAQDVASNSETRANLDQAETEEGHDDNVSGLTGDEEEVTHEDTDTETDIAEEEEETPEGVSQQSEAPEEETAPEESEDEHEASDAEKPHENAEEAQEEAGVEAPANAPDGEDAKEETDAAADSPEEESANEGADVSATSPEGENAEEGADASANSPEVEDAKEETEAAVDSPEGKNAEEGVDVTANSPEVEEAKEETEAAANSPEGENVNEGAEATANSPEDENAN